MADETDIIVTLTSEDLAGLPADLVAAARQAAVERNLAEGSYVITLSRSLVEPFITFSERRDLREKAWKLWTSRGNVDILISCFVAAAAPLTSIFCQPFHLHFFSQ